jgi:hypothetical protein
VDLPGLLSARATGIRWRSWNDRRVLRWKEASNQGLRDFFERNRRLFAIGAGHSGAGALDNQIPSAPRPSTPQCGKRHLIATARAVFTFSIDHARDHAFAWPSIIIEAKRGLISAWKQRRLSDVPPKGSRRFKMGTQAVDLLLGAKAE